MNIDILLVLVIAVFVTGSLALVDKLWFAPQRVAAEKTTIPLLFDYARSFFPILLAVLLIRSFAVQAFRVPTGSLEPTVMPGELIVVNQSAYGLRLPVLHTKVVEIGVPNRGDLVVFRWPVDERIIFVKRVVGVPGDRLQYKNKILYVNGEQASQTFVRDDVDVERGLNLPVERRTENLTGKLHDIFVRNGVNLNKDFEITIPEGHYFMMGDNRDNSADSRVWGFVSDDLLIGKAFYVLFSWDKYQHKVRWQRVGTVLS